MSRRATGLTRCSNAPSFMASMVLVLLANAVSMTTGTAGPAFPSLIRRSTAMPSMPAILKSRNTASGR